MCVTFLVSANLATLLTLTNDGAVAEEELVELTSKGGEEAAERRHQAAQHCRETRGVPATHANCDGRDEQRQGGGQPAQPACGGGRGSLTYKIMQEVIS